MSEPFSSLAREERVLSFVNLDGAPAMQICADNGVTVDTFTGTFQRGIFEVASNLHAKHQLTAGGEILGEEAIARGVCDWSAFVNATRQIPAFGVYPAELPPLCRELKRLENKRALRGQSDAMNLALKDDDPDRVRAALGQLQQADLSSRPRATWRQTGGVEIERAKAIIEGREDPDIRTISWPWRALDIDMKPFRRGEQVVVAGYTSNGKSSLLRQLTLASAKAEQNTAFVSLEVPAADIFNLMAAAQSDQPWSRLKGLHPSDQQAFLKGGAQVRALTIEVLDDEYSLPGIIAWLRNQHSRRFLDVIAIDYLGLVTECSPHKGQTKAQAVGEVAGAFKRLAAELKCVLFLAVQINRSPTNDGNREPKLSDLKDSGDIEAHADRVLLLYRPDYDKAGKCDQSTHESITDRQRFYMELFQEKGRNVGTASTALWFRREVAKFELINW